MTTSLGLHRTTARAIISQWKTFGIVVNLPGKGWPAKISPRGRRQCLEEVTTDPSRTSKDGIVNFADYQEILKGNARSSVCDLQLNPKHKNKSTTE